jgi:hypothetical protein
LLEDGDGDFDSGDDDDGDGDEKNPSMAGLTPADNGTVSVKLSFNELD